MKANAAPKSDLQRALGQFRGSFVSVGVFSMFINLLMLVPPIYMLQIYDRVLASRSESTLLLMTLIMVALLVVMGGLEWVRSRILVRVGARLDTVLSERLFSAMFDRSLRGGGAGSTQPLNDLGNIRQFLTGPSLFAFFDAPWMPFYILILFLFHPLLGWIAVAAAVVLFALTLANEKTTQRPLAAANEENAKALTFANDNLRNAEVLEAMGMLGDVRRRWNGHHHNMLALQARASDQAGTWTSMSKSARFIFQSLILGAGAYLAIDQIITPGIMIAGSILLGRALAPIDQMTSTWRSFVSARGAYGRLNALLLEEPPRPETMSLPEPRGHLLVDNAIVVPPGAQAPALRGVSFEVEPGEGVGIVGASAAGKSTLARAVLGVWPTRAGKVRLDGADVYSWDRSELGPHIGYLPQDIELFDGTIAENIARFGEVSPDQVVAAASRAGVHDMILRLPNGYDTPIGVGGGILSGGQRQRVGLARAIYGDPKLVVLDEPNSNLDEKGEAALAQVLRDLKGRGCTVLVITHRPSALAQVDKVLVLNEGLVKLFGPREQVLGRFLAPAQGARPAGLGNG